MSEHGAAVAATRRSYDAVAARYAAEVGGELAAKPLDRALLDAFAETVPAGPVLDAGCGPGHVGGYLASSGRPVLGLDLAPSMCAIASRDAGLPACAGDLTALPVRSASLAGLISLYAVIHLDAGQRAAAYAEFARVLRPAGQALVSFHTSAAGQAAGSTMTVTEWWGQPVQLSFGYLDPAVEISVLAAAGLRLSARLDRAPNPAVEHASWRSYLLLVREG